MTDKTENPAARVQNGQLVTNVYEAFEAGYQQAMVDIAEQKSKEYPVAWMYEKPVMDGFSELTLSFGYEPKFDGIVRPLFVESKPKHQPLSNDEIAELWGDDELRNPSRVRNFVRAIEKAHGIGESE
jgi:hypothetical protein